MWYTPLMAAITVTDSATEILAPTVADGDNPFPTGQVFLYNGGSVDIYLGRDADVTTSNGLPLAAGATLGMTLPTGRSVYGIVASGTAEVRTLVA